jgi:hypothetical protein
MRLDSAAWFSWLEQDATRSFSYPIFDRRCGYIIGFLTVRKEARQRGGRYWSVYRHQGGRVWKRYLGQSGSVTAARLEELAGNWLRERAPPARHGACTDGRRRSMQQRGLTNQLAAQP